MGKVILTWRLNADDEGLVTRLRHRGYGSTTEMLREGLRVLEAQVLGAVGVRPVVGGALVADEGSQLLGSVATELAPARAVQAQRRQVGPAAPSLVGPTLSAGEEETPTEDGLLGGDPAGRACRNERCPEYGKPKRPAFSRCPHCRHALT